MAAKEVIGWLFVAWIGGGNVFAQSDEPSLTDTERWLESDGMKLMRNAGSNLDSRVRSLFSLYTSTVTAFDLDQCVVTWKIDSRSEAGPPFPGTINSSSTFRVPLGGLDVGSISVASNTGLVAGASLDFVRMKTRAAVGKTLIETGSEGKKYEQDEVSIPVDSSGSGQRVMNALRRAAILCGAPASAF